MSIFKKIIYFLDPSLKTHAYILIFLLILNAFADSLTIALIIPIIIFFFNKDLASTYPEIVSIIEFFSPFKYLKNDYGDQTIIITGLLGVFSLLIILRIIFNIMFLYFKSDLKLKTRFLITRKLFLNQCQRRKTLRWRLHSISCRKAYPKELPLVYL